MESKQKLEALHLQIQDMLAGYVDDELDEREACLVEAHLAGCEACARDVVRQQMLHEKLGAIPHEQMAPAQKSRLDNVLEKALQKNGARHAALAALRRRAGHWFRFVEDRWMAAGGWSLAVFLAVIMVFNASWRHPDGGIPMVEDVVAEYQHIAVSPLPNAEPVATAQPPASWPRARVLASWRTRISGKPAQAYAVRSDNKVLLQVKVGEQVFYNNPKVRKAVADAGRYEVLEQGLKVVALPLDHGGLLLVGPPEGMPDAGTMSLKSF